jgi:hypothetical protein
MTKKPRMPTITMRNGKFSVQIAPACHLTWHCERAGDGSERWFIDVDAPIEIHEIRNGYALTRPSRH